MCCGRRPRPPRNVVCERFSFVVERPRRERLRGTTGPPSAGNWPRPTARTLEAFFGEWHDRLNRVGVDEQHQQPIDSERIPTAFRHAVLERLKKTLIHRIDRLVGITSVGLIAYEPPPLLVCVGELAEPVAELDPF